MTSSVEEMSDDQLFEALKENGFAPGPIVDSTRAIYRKKLLAIINNDVKEASEEEEEEEVEDDEDDQPSGIESPVVDHVASGLRQRFGADQLDSADLLRSTPTPRNVHNYTEVQTTSQNVVKTKNGLETRDTTRTVEKTETKATGSGPGWITALATRLFQLALLCLVLAAAYYIFTKIPADDGGVKNVQDAMKEAAAREEKQSVV